MMLKVLTRPCSGNKSHDQGSAEDMVRSSFLCADERVGLTIVGMLTIERSRF